MGRNPAVGRQGPAHHAAVIPGGTRRSACGSSRSARASAMPSRMNRTLKALGLRHHQDVSTMTNTAALRGMLYKVRHLVEVTPVKGKALTWPTGRTTPSAEPITLAHAARPRPGSHRDPQAASAAARAPGIGKTSGKGHKGQKARTGGSDQPGLRRRPDADVPAACPSAASPIRSR